MLVLLSLVIGIVLLLGAVLLVDIYAWQEQFTWRPFGEDRPSYCNIEARMAIERQES